jgi:AIPR protein
MDSNDVRQKVKQFYEKTAHTGGEEHCFAPWYLHGTFRISETQAMRQSSDGNYDFGVDAFHLAAQDGGEPPALVLVQAKYTDSLQQIGKGLRDLEKALPEVVKSLEGIGTDEAIQNNVLTNLRAALNRLDPAAKGHLRLDFQVLHLSEEDGAILFNRLRKAREHLAEALRESLENHVCTISLVGPRDLGHVHDVVAPPEEVVLRIDGAYEFACGKSGKMVTGVGLLSDLVDLYNARRDDLFSRNVRYYLTSKKNTERGPAGKMRGTLREMCVDGKVDPERFALFHNGVTIFSRRLRLLDGQVHVRDPYVLNGCQTIKNAFFFRFDPQLRSKIKGERWSRVAVPLRIIETSDDDLVRSITVNTNRQNEMSPASLRANEPVQLRLESRFKEREIFYQRQLGALESIVMMQPELLEDIFKNTPPHAAVDINDLARAIAATAGEISLALRPNQLFESDAAYSRCFNEKTRLRSIIFLTFLQNLHAVVGLVLKKDLKLEPKEQGGPKPSRFVYHTICLLARHLAKERMHDFVTEWGQKLYASNKDLREAIRSILNSHASGIRSHLAKTFMALPAKARADDVNAAFKDCESTLQLKDNINPFETFANLDDFVA